jgi:cytochrome c oxidase assembly protein Cox11
MTKKKRKNKTWSCFLIATITVLILEFAVFPLVSKTYRFITSFEVIRDERIKLYDKKVQHYKDLANRFTPEKEYCLWPNNPFDDRVEWNTARTNVVVIESEKKDRDKEEFNKFYYEDLQEARECNRERFHHEEMFRLLPVN